MKILHTIAGFNKQAGGVSSCTYNLLKCLHKNNMDVDLLSSLPNKINQEVISNGEEWVHLLKYDCKTAYYYSVNLKKYLSENNQYDVYHTNGLWLYCNHVTCSTAREKRKPYIIATHGMLYPEALKRASWKKWPFKLLYFNKDIKKANCIVATCNKEMEYIRDFGYQGPVAVIPNITLIPEYVNEFKHDYSHRIFGFLGRLHPIKKIDRILQAMHLCKDAIGETELWIMGEGSEEYETFLHQETVKLGLDKNVKFLGFVDGEEKFRKLNELSLLLVPSDFENFGMIIPEALSVGTPVAASLGTPWEELNTYNCGWWIDNNPEDIAAIMKKNILLSDDRLSVLGQNGRRLVKQFYSEDTITSKYTDLYNWISQGGFKPDFIFI